MELSVVTLNFKKSELTLKCMQSLYEAYKKDFEDNFMELIIVDNASGDDSVPILREEIRKQKYKNYTLLPNDSNSGFGAGNDFGAQKAKGKYILFLNNDTIIKDRGLLNMVDYMGKHPNIAILGGSLKNFDGTLQPSVGTFYTPIKATMLLLGMQRFNLLDKSPNRIEKVDWVKGALLMIRKEIYNKLGGFDKNIFMYTEDMELCYRARKAGYEIWFYPSVTVLHIDQGSSNRTFAIVNIFKNLQYFYKKHRPMWEYMYIRTLLKTKAGLLVVLGKLIHNTYLISTYEQALATTR